MLPFAKYYKNNDWSLNKKPDFAEYGLSSLSEELGAYSDQKVRDLVA